MQDWKIETTYDTTSQARRKENTPQDEKETIMLPSRKITTPPTLTSDRVDRTSFSSVKETDTGIAQSFTESKTSSYLRNEFSFTNEVEGSEEAVFEDGSSGGVTPENERERVLGKFIPGTLTNPESRLRGFVCPCDGFRGWKGISVRGRVASKSSGDLRALGNWDWEIDSAKVKKVVEKEELAGKSPLESLPMELLGEFEFGRSWDFADLDRIYHRSTGN